MSKEQVEAATDKPLDKVLGAIAMAIRIYQKERREVRTYRIRQGLPQTGDQQLAPLPDIDPHQSMHAACTNALATFNHPVHVKDLQPILRKLYNRRITPTQIYMALEYRRREKGDVGREKGGLWFVRRLAAPHEEPSSPPATPPAVSH